MRRVRSGDEVWIVSNERRRLFLEGHLRVESVVGRAEAEARLRRENLWDAPLYALAPVGLAEPTKRMDISTLVSELTFEGRPSRLPTGWTVQSLQTMRKLTDHSAQVLRSAWSSAEHHPVIGQSVPRNPPWTRDELILALDLYLQLDRRLPSPTDPEVVALSALLNTLPIHTDRPDEEKFRNANGVVLKIANFRALDQPGHGMSAGGRLDREVWNEFSARSGELHAIAVAIHQGHSSAAAKALTVATEDEDEEAFVEGRVLYRHHRARERSRDLVKRKKAQALKKHGRLACEICGFDFAAMYGDLGDGFIECHHTRPVSELDTPAAVKLSDVALICSNCHRMVHRRRPWLTMAGLTGILK
jgi:5-methylcytosine-specific restriction enzyme A